MPEADDVDILLITALRLEFEAAMEVASASGGGPGVEHWSECDPAGIAPYWVGVHVDQHGVRRSLALAQLDRMGGRGVGPFTTTLVKQLRPVCLAMSGICAGNPDKVGLGDVVVAELAYEYDEGKLTTTGFDPDHRQIPLDRRWVRAALDLRPDTLPSHSRATRDEAEIWFLEQLLSGADPRQHPACFRYFPGSEWSSGPAALARNGLVARASGGGGWQLTDAGRNHIEAVCYDRSGGPQRLPFKVVTGPMASGSGVVADGRAWLRLRAQGVRSVVGMEMEAATIATVAQDLRVPHWLVAKGVVDHADPHKDDRYQEFAARASAEVLLDLVTKLVPARPGGGRSGAVWLDRLRGEGLAVWEPADIMATMSGGGSGDDSPELAVNEIIDLSLIRDGRISGVGSDFVGLVEAVTVWSALGHRKWAGSGTRILWLVGEPGQLRSRAWLAGLGSIGAARLDVYDAGRELALAARTIEAAMLAAAPGPPAAVGVDLPAGQDSAGWDDLREILVRIRRLEGRQGHLYPPFIVGGTAAQEQRAYDVLGSLVEITSVDLRGRPHQRPNSETGAEGMASENLTAEHVYNRGLPVTGSRLFGRLEELRKLQAAWDDPGTHILAVVAPGGVGKSALINEWLRDMRGADYRDAQKVLAWSFYSQGTRDTTVPADPFVSFALDWLDDEHSDEPLAADAGPVEKGIRLAELVRRQRMLLVLDGMEPLQYPDSAPADLAGTFIDAAITALLEELAQPGGAGGLCLVTTRVALPALDAYVMTGGSPTRSPVTTVKLGNLDDKAGAELLQHLLGRPYPFTELQATVRKVDGHALALNLLGRYLRQVHAGDLSGQYDLDRLDQAAPDGGHAGGSWT